MANIEWRSGVSIGRRLPSPVATFLPPPPARPAAPRPDFSRVDAGQLIRSVALLLLCLGVSFLPRGEKLPAQSSVAQPVALKP